MLRYSASAIQLLMPTTAADTLILHTPGGGGSGMGVARCCSCSSKSADVWCDAVGWVTARMGALTTDNGQLLMTVSRYREMTRGVCTAT